MSRRRERHSGVEGGREMKNRKRWIVLVLTIAALPLAACGGGSSGSEEASEPAVLEQIEGSDAMRIVLTEEAAKRLAIETAPAQETTTGGTSAQVTIPYAAVLYEPEGATFTYTSPEPLVFVRQPITVDRIEGDLAFLTEGPSAGTPVVVVGAAELYGTEIGVDH
jgi:hypothetical protein